MARRTNPIPPDTTWTKRTSLPLDGSPRLMKRFLAFYNPNNPNCTADPDCYRPGYGYHSGVDWNYSGQADRGLGEPVRAVADGWVVNSSPTLSARGYGQLVYIKHPQFGRWTRYAHLASRKVKTGDVVRAGQIVGTMGTSGTDNVHLHFDVPRRALPQPRFIQDVKDDKSAMAIWFEDPEEFLERIRAKSGGVE